MRTLILSRLSQLVLVLLAVTFLSFSAMNVLGDPLFNIIGPLAELDCDAVARGEIGSTSSSLDATRTDCEIVAEVKAEFRLDEPLLKRYVLWLGDSVRGDFGTAFASEGVPVSEILKNKLPASIKLMIYAEVIALSLAIPLGVYGAYRANRRADRVLSVVSFGALAIPNFALGVVLQCLERGEVVVLAGVHPRKRACGRLPATSSYGFGDHAPRGLCPYGPGQGNDGSSHHVPPRTTAFAVLCDHGVRGPDRCLDRWLACGRADLSDPGCWA